MKITDVRTRVVQWEGKIVPLPPHFCTNPMDLVAFRQASMGNFAFHGWVLVEIFTDSGLVGLGNAALSPIVTKTLIDTYLKPLLIGADPFRVEELWERMYVGSAMNGRRGAIINAIGALDIALHDLRGKALGNNPNLVTLVQAERWNGVLPTTMVPGSSVPFVSVK